MAQWTFQFYIKNEATVSVMTYEEINQQQKRDRRFIGLVAILKPMASSTQRTVPDRNLYISQTLSVSFTTLH